MCDESLPPQERQCVTVDPNGGDHWLSWTGEWVVEGVGFFRVYIEDFGDFPSFCLQALRISGAYWKDYNRKQGNGVGPGGTCRKTRVRRSAEVLSMMDAEAADTAVNHPTLCALEDQQDLLEFSDSMEGSPIQRGENVCCENEGSGGGRTTSPRKRRSRSSDTAWRPKTSRLRTSQLPRQRERRRSVEEDDELLRRVMLESLADAYPTTPSADQSNVEAAAAIYAATDRLESTVMDKTPARSRKKKEELQLPPLVKHEQLPTVSTTASGYYSSFPTTTTTSTTHQQTAKRRRTSSSGGGTSQSTGSIRKLNGKRLQAWEDKDPSHRRTYTVSLGEYRLTMCCETSWRVI